MLRKSSHLTRLEPIRKKIQTNYARIHSLKRTLHFLLLNRRFLWRFNAIWKQKYLQVELSGTERFLIFILANPERYIYTISSYVKTKYTYTLLSSTPWFAQALMVINLPLGITSSTVHVTAGVAMNFQI